MACSATWTAVASRNAMPDASTVTTTSQRPGAVPRATGSGGDVTGTVLADDGVREPVGERRHRAGGGKGDHPGRDDVAGHAPADGGEPAGRTDAHDRGGRDVRRRDGDREDGRRGDHDARRDRLRGEAAGRGELDD